MEGLVQSHCNFVSRSYFFCASCLRHSKARLLVVKHVASSLLSASIFFGITHILIPAFNACSTFLYPWAVEGGWMSSAVCVSSEHIRFGEGFILEILILRSAVNRCAIDCNAFISVLCVYICSAWTASARSPFLESLSKAWSVCGV